MTQFGLEWAVWALKRFDHFNGLVDSSVGRLVRIIPVSAVGPVFARIEDSVGTVVKRRDGQVHPRNVEVPLCAVVPDVFRQVKRQLDDQRRRAIDALRKGSGFRATEVLSICRILHQAGRGACKGRNGRRGRRRGRQRGESNVRRMGGPPLRERASTAAGGPG